MKEILFNQEGRIKLLEGAFKVYATVKITLGARGRNAVIFEKKGMYPYITKDGINTINRINLEDPAENMGALLIRQASAKTAEETGDGTTTTAIIAYSMIDGGMSLLDKHDNQVAIINAMEKIVGEIIKQLKEYAIMPNEDDINNIAIISSNNDQVIGAMIGELINKLGVNGTVVIQDSINGKTYYEEASGMKVNSGWISPYQVNNHEKGLMEYDNPLIMVTDEEIFRIKQVEKFIGLCIQNNRPGIIVCSQAGGEALGTINHNIVNKGLKIGVINAPDHGGLSRDILSDIAEYCGAVMITEKTGKATDKVVIEQLGSCRKWVSDSVETTIIDGKGDTSLREKELINYIEHSKDEKRVKDSKHRLANLTGKTAVVYVYADTPSELVEKKDRIDDAIHACRAAMAEGIVPGGGLTLYDISKNIELAPKNDIETDAFNIVIRAIRAPMLTVLSNANLNLAKYEADLTSSNGVNVLTEQVEDLVASGIVDPAKSIRVSVKNAFSVTRTILTTDAVLC